MTYHATLIAGAVFITAILPLACGKPASSEDPVAVSTAVMHVTFPSDTRVIGYYRSKDPANTRFSMIPTPDDAICLKIETARKNIDALLAASPFAGKELSGTARSVSNHSLNQPWWDPEKPRRFKSGEEPLPNGCQLNILIDMDNDAKAVVYLNWFET